MEKSTFIKLMQEFIQLRKDEDDVNTAVRKFDPDFGYFSLGRYESLFLDAIRAAMDDKHDEIGYWCYDLNFGRDAKKDSVTDKNGKGIPIKTLSNLYDLIKNYNN